MGGLGKPVQACTDPRGQVRGRPKGRRRSGKVADGTAGHRRGGRVERGREGRWQGQGRLVAVDSHCPGEQLSACERDGSAIEAGCGRGDMREGVDQLPVVERRGDRGGPLLGALPTLPLYLRRATVGGGLLGLASLPRIGGLLLGEDLGDVPALTQRTDDPARRLPQRLRLRRRDDVGEPLSGIAADEVVSDTVGDAQGGQPLAHADVDVAARLLLLILRNNNISMLLSDFTVSGATMSGFLGHGPTRHRVRSFRTRM